MPDDFAISVLQEAVRSYREIKSVLPPRWELYLNALGNLWELVRAIPILMLIIFLSKGMPFIRRWFANRCRV